MTATARVPRIALGVDRRELDPKAGFAHFGEFLQAIRKHPARGKEAESGPNLHPSYADIEERLRPLAAVPSVSGSEGIGADGGFLVPPEFGDQVLTLAQLDGLLLPLFNPITTSSNSMSFPGDETSPWGATGNKAYWQGELAAPTLQKSVLGLKNMRMHKLQIYEPVSDDLAADAAALDTYLPERFGAAFANRINESVIRGTGTGQPLGVLNSPALVTVAKEGSQATSTIQIQNLAHLWTRLPGGSHSRAFILIHPDALAALVSLAAPLVELRPVPDSYDGPPAVASFLGLPIIVSQHCAAFSSLGDIIVIDPRYYRVITKDPPMQIARSMHLYFDADATAFRANFRIDGSPAIAQPIQPASGSTTLSPFLTLQAR